MSRSLRCLSAPVFLIVLGCLSSAALAQTGPEKPPAKTDPAKAAPAKTDTPKPPAKTDLPGFKTVETAATTRISRAAPTPETKQPSFLGVHLDRDARGRLVIAHVAIESPAAQAGLKEGDLLVQVDGKPVADPDGLRLLLQTKEPGAKVKISASRKDKPMSVEATLGAVSRPLTGNDGRGGRRGWDSRRQGVFSKATYRLAVVAIEYPDAKHNTKVSPKEWEKALFSRAAYKGKSVTGQTVHGSLNDYYLEQSCGSFQVAGKVFDYVEVKNKRESYGTGSNRTALFNEALDKLLARDGKDALKDFDGIFFLYAGGRVRTQRGGLYWPHRSNFSYKEKRWSYFICPEGGTQMASISVISHEFGHMLGLPDLYARPDSPGAEGLGVWCTMATGHGRDGKPLHFSAWCKERLNWLKPVVIDPRVKQKLVLAPVENSAKECFKVLLRPDGSEYLLLENRVRRGFDRDLPGEGLLIWRVHNGRPVLEESHGVAGPAGPGRFLGSVPYPSKANDAFTPLTTPSSRPLSGDGFPVHITNIRRLPDGRITFFIGYDYF